MEWKLLAQLDRIFVILKSSAGMKAAFAMDSYAGAQNATFLYDVFFYGVNSGNTCSGKCGLEMPG